MVHRISAVVVFVVLITAQARAQNTFESSGGESSLALRGGGLLHINFADANVSFGLVRQVSTDRWRAGMDGTLKARDGLVSLVDEGFALRSGSISGFLGHDFLPTDSIFQYEFLAGRVKYTRATLDILPDNSATLEVLNTKFNGATAGVVYNAFLDTARGNGGGEEFLLGIAVDYGRQNNADKLDTVQVCDESRSVTTATQTVRRVSSCKDASTGTYLISNRVTAALDLLWYQRWSSNRVALAFLGRYDELKHDTAFVPGFGIFVTESGAPLKMQGGFTIEAIDHKPRVGLQVGFPF
jgi:hypothetical protein